MVGSIGLTSFGFSGFLTRDYLVTGHHVLVFALIQKARFFGIG